MKKFFQDNLKAGLLFSLIGIFLMIFKFGLLGIVFSVFGLIKSRKAIKEGKQLGIIGGILSFVGIAYFLLIVFILGYVLTKR